MISPLVINAIDRSSMLKQTHWVLTASGAAVDTQTITMKSIVFTTVTTLGSTPGQVLIGASQTETLANLVTLVNTPTVTTSTGVALSEADATKLKDLGLVASSSGAVFTVKYSKDYPLLTFSETQSNMAWTHYYQSNPIPMIAPCGRTSIQCIGASIANGNGVFTVEVSNDGSNWVAYNRLNSNVTNTNSQTDTRVASVTINSNSSAIVTFPIDDAFAFMRIIATPTTDGFYSAYVYVS